MSEEKRSKKEANGEQVNATYTSTGVRAPWVMEQQTAPAKENLP